MIKDTWRVTGLMSGTSLDGLDMASCEFIHEGEKWSFKLVASKSLAYDKSWHNRLKSSVDMSAVELLLLHNEYGTWLGQQVKLFIDENDLDLDFIASHGHTVFHQPEQGLTFQVGSGQHLANACGLKVISDFRTQDVALGGQGAPLVPIGDQLLFSEYDLCLNLGGIANVSFDHHGERMAYDIGLANMLLNHLAGQLGLPYDDDGKMARSGTLDQELLDQLNALPYFQQPFPKSTGYEWFSAEVVPIVDKHKASTEDKLHTSVHHIVFQIAEAVKRSSHSGRLLATGGGARNAFLTEMLRHHLNNNVEVVIPEPSIIDFKEAIVFAFMGVLKIRNEVNCLKSVTGAREDSSSGVVFLPAHNM